MSLYHVHRQIIEDANEGVDRPACVDRAASSALLADWIYEALITNHGLQLSAEDLRAVRETIAFAMVAQHAFDQSPAVGKFLRSA
jgi:hypothetical protein